MTPPLPHPFTALAFDYGLRRLGIAVGQSLTGTASPVTVLRMRDGAPDWPAIAALLATWEPDVLVVGLPLNMDGSEQPLTARARGFARRLRGRFGLPVHEWDERLTSREARERLDAAGRTRAADDAVAAEVILESWLGAHRPAAGS
ncbi:MAG: Holliday junction resolvase RuvX [Ectothiorhodospiraceae bacterium]|nr:Holliday junction resolvase RuvX [Chromatiales bacterium]MCP5157312.1 Holliday junction resolvase RuvX [Ectothiorhodospiraceae bacterium]